MLNILGEDYIHRGTFMKYKSYRHNETAFNDGLCWPGIPLGQSMHLGTYTKYPEYRQNFSSYPIGVTISAITYADNQPVAGILSLYFSVDPTLHTVT